MLYANITNHENSNPIEVPTEDDGTILLSTITGQYPGATSLNFCFNGKLRAISIMDGRLYAPEGGWGDMIYRCVFPEAKSILVSYNFVKKLHYRTGQYYTYFLSFRVFKLHHCYFYYRLRRLKRPRLDHCLK